jgi:hypothetical protein
MPSVQNITNIPAPRVNFIDDRTGLMSREWYRFFLNLFTLTGGGTTAVSLEDLQLGPAFEITPSMFVVDNPSPNAESAIATLSLSVLDLWQNLQTLPMDFGGTVSSVGTGTGLSGGPITSSGTISFAVAAVGTWADAPSSANLAAAMTDETGSGPLVFATLPSITTTLGVGGAAASASGSGISFPATQSASTDANTLDDYEEGTWTLTVTPGSGAITSYTVQSAKYTKIGNLVTAIIKFTITNNGTGASFLQINLPFTSADECVGTIRENNITGTQGNIRTSGANAFLLTYNSLYPAQTGAVITGTVTFNV